MKPGIILAVLACCAALVGCGSDEPAGTSPDDPSTGAVRYYELPDGRTVLCVWEWQKSGYAGGAGLDCDWDGAKENKK